MRVSRVYLDSILTIGIRTDLYQATFVFTTHAANQERSWGIAKVRRFELAEPTTLQEACGILAERPDVKPIAGGTALLTLIKHGLFAPKLLVNLKKIKTANDIEYDPAYGLRIGALASIYEIENSPWVRRHYPVLADGCHVVSNIRIRNMATIGGNLAHADYQSDPPTVLIALNASVEVISARGGRSVQLSDFFRGSYDTALEPGELVSTVLVPPLPSNSRGAYIKFTTGSSEERPCAGVAAIAAMDDHVLKELRLVVGAVSPAPVSVGTAIAREERLTPKLVDYIAAEAARAVEPVDDLRGPAHYKRHIVKILARRAISRCTEA